MHNPLPAFWLKSHLLSEQVQQLKATLPVAGTELEK
jgi:hypothetical protein